jgi:hypothetical protein
MKDRTPVFSTRLYLTKQNGQDSLGSATHSNKKAKMPELKNMKYDKFIDTLMTTPMARYSFIQN